jgi:hypothetical protein
MLDQLREEIRTSGRTLLSLAEATGVDTGRLSRFMHGKRGLTAQALDTLFRELGLKIIRGTVKGKGNK